LLRDIAVINALDQDLCPDCAGFIFRPGPRGGASQNVECVGCGSRFNVVRGHSTLKALLDGRPMPVIHAERIRRDDRGIGRWREDMFPKVLQ
jgi:hypothetical protein